MKRIIITVLLISLISPMYSESLKKLIPLSKNEKLEYLYDQNKYILTIFKSQGTEKQVYYESLDALWGGYQISKDKKSMIFWEDTFESNMPLYYLNGNNGEIKLLGRFPLNTRLDEYGNNIMYEKVYKSGVFTIQDLKTGIITDVIWNLSNKEKWTARGGTFTILRAADNKEYDFMLIFGMEGLSIAKAFVKVNTFNIFTEYDDSNLEEVQLRKTTDYQSEFTGWY